MKRRIVWLALFAVVIAAGAAIAVGMSSLPERSGGIPTTRVVKGSLELNVHATGELRAGRTGNEILSASLAKMRSAGIDGTVYSHPIGTHGHGAGPLIGLWDYQDGVPGRGDHAVIPNMWFSIELQATTAVPEWNGQRVRSAQEEDMVIGADGVPRWALRRQTAFHLVH